MTTSRCEGSGDGFMTRESLYRAVRVFVQHLGWIWLPPVYLPGYLPCLANHGCTPGYLGTLRPVLVQPNSINQLQQFEGSRCGWGPPA